MVKEAYNANALQELFILEELSVPFNLTMKR